MNSILQRFGRSRVLLPVVHCIDMRQALDAMAVATDAGADGVFLINQGGMSWNDVLRLAGTSGPPWVGVNLLGEHIVDVVERVASYGSAIAGIWQDDAKMHPDRVDIADRSGWALRHAREAAGWGGLYFGGVAFKYVVERVPPEQWGEAAKLACGWVDVITTSGPATGAAAPVEKVRVMREAIGDHALALASGVTPENVEVFLPFVDAFLVASGIEERFGVFDPSRVKALADAIHGFAA